LDSLVVTHPFHPLRGERLRVLFVRRQGASWLYVCEGGPRGTIGIAEVASDRGPEPGERPLSFEALAAVAVLVSELSAGRGVAR
jgi:hypothetical protein